MAEVPPVSFSIEITDVESRGSRVTLTASSTEQDQFYDGDVIRGFVIVEVSSIYYLKYLGIDLVGSTSIKVQRVDSTVAAPKSFKNKEVFLWKTQALAGTPPTPSLTPSRSSPASPAVTSQGRLIQLNRGRHVLPFELTLETGATPGSVSWQNTSMPSQATHNVSATLSYKLKVLCTAVDSSKVVQVAKRQITVGGFEHSRESLKAMVSKGSGKTKMGSLTFPLMDGTLTYAATLDSRAYHLGETALLTLVVDNKLPHPVNSISVRFNNFISLFGPIGKKDGASNTNLNSSLSMSSSFSAASSTEESFTETEVLTLINERYSVKSSETVKRVISVVIPQGAFSTTKYTRGVNMMAFLDVTVNVQSHTPSVSEKSFQVPIYVINTLPQRHLAQSSSSSLSSSQSVSLPPVIVGSTDSLPNGHDEPVLTLSSSSTSPYGSMKDFSGTPSQTTPGIVIWTNDDEVKQCTLCKNDFTLLRRRHHCRSCGRVMCGKCGKEATCEQLFGSKPQRMCTLCLSELSELSTVKGVSNLSLSASISGDIDESAQTISYGTDDAVSPRNFRTSLQLLAAGSSTGNLQVSSNGHYKSNSGSSPPFISPLSGGDSTPPVIEVTPCDDDLPVVDA